MQCKLLLPSPVGFCKACFWSKAITRFALSLMTFTLAQLTSMRGRPKSSETLDSFQIHQIHHGDLVTAHATRRGAVRNLRWPICRAWNPSKAAAFCAVRPLSRAHQGLSPPCQRPVVHRETTACPNAWHGRNDERPPCCCHLAILGQLSRKLSLFLTCFDSFFDYFDVSMCCSAYSASWAMVTPLKQRAWHR